MKSKTIQVELLKKGRRKYGAFYTFPDGRRIYLAFRNHRDIFRSGEKTIRSAIAMKTACWALDVDTITLCRGRGVSAVGIQVRDTGDLYLTSLKTFQDRKKAKVLNFESRGGSLQYYLPLHLFRFKPGKIKL